MPTPFGKGAAAFRNGRDWAKERRDQFISAANERAGYEEPPTLHSASYSGPSQTAENYPAEESQTSADGPKELSPSEDELAASSYPAASPYPAATSSSYHVEESDYDDLSDITEELALRLMSLH
jgi:hypothetical protein